MFIRETIVAIPGPKVKENIELQPAYPRLKSKRLMKSPTRIKPAACSVANLTISY